MTHHSQSMVVTVRMKFLEVSTKSAYSTHGGLMSSTDDGWIDTIWYRR